MKLITRSTLLEAGETVAMIDVLVRPPNESCNKRVNLDSLEKQKQKQIEKLLYLLVFNILIGVLQRQTKDSQKTNCNKISDLNMSITT
jgi:hypothetical protein